MLPMRCTTQSYDWGVPASQESKVLSLARANGVDAALKAEGGARFAELWVGSHPSGCATVANAAGQGSMSLETWLDQNPDALGRTLAELAAKDQPSGRLPFLMKVLSADKPLPLQAHPTAAAAKRLHQQDPEMYPDAAAKPEMVICLNNFCGFAGFLPYDKLSQQLARLPQLAAALGDNNVQDYLAAGSGNDAVRYQALASMLQQLLLHTPPGVCSQTLDAVLKHLQAEQQGSGPVLLPASTQDTTAAVTGAATAAGGGGDDGSPHTDSHIRQPPSTPTSAGGAGSSSSTAAERVGNSAAGSGPTTGTSSPAVAAEASRLSGPTEPVAKACDLSMALGLVSQPGGLGQRGAMIAAAAEAWPADAAGVLALLLLEDVVLQKGEAVLIPAGCPHAYICGEMIEVQAASNNTIKGDLTAHGEPTDKNTLIDAVTGCLSPAVPPSVPPASGTAGDTSPLVPEQSPNSTLDRLYEGPPPVVPATVPGGALPHGCVEGLRLYQPPGVQEFQAWHVNVQAGQKVVDLVVDPGPGVLLVTGGSGFGVCKAGVVVSEMLVDEAELHPGTALFIPAGTSLSISGSSSTEALEAWITTANSRMFTAAAPAGAVTTSTAAAAGGAVQVAGEGPSVCYGLYRSGQLGGCDIVTGNAAGKAGATAAGVDPGMSFTAAEQVAAALMAGAARSSCPANIKDASAAVAGGGGGGGGGGAGGKEERGEGMEVD